MQLYMCTHTHIRVGTEERVHMYRESREPGCVHPLKWINILAWYIYNGIFGQTLQAQSVLSHNLQEPFIGFIGIWTDG